MVFLPVVSCHGDGIERITLAAERRGTLEECTVVSEQLIGALRRWRHRVPQEREDEKVTAIRHAEERRAEEFAIKWIDEDWPLAHVVHGQSGQRLANQSLRVGRRDE